MISNIKIIIVDDHPLFLIGYKNLFQNYSEIIISGEANNGKQLINLMDEGIGVDLILLDIEMPIMNGKQALLELKKRYPKTKIVMVSFHKSDELEAYYIMLGANGYLCKTSDPEIIMKTILRVVEKGFYFNEKIAGIIKKGIKTGMTLSLKEKEILLMLCNGLMNKEIAYELKKNLKTIDFHKKNIVQKSGCKNDVQLGIFAKENGLFNK